MGLRVLNCDLHGNVDREIISQTHKDRVFRNGVKVTNVVQSLVNSQAVTDLVSIGTCGVRTRRLIVGFGWR